MLELTTAAIAAAAARLPTPRRRRRIRLDAGLSQAALGAQAGISQAAIAQYEKGISKPTGERLIRYVEALEALVALRRKVGAA